MIAHDRQPYFKANTDIDFRFFGAPTVLHATGDATEGHYCLMEQVAMPPGLASPYHVHHNEDEAFYVLEGTVAFLCGTAWRVAGPGTWVYGPREIPHGFRVMGTSPARMLIQCSPAGFDQFVRELCVPMDAAPAPPDMAVLGAAAARYGIDLLGPLPEMPPQAESSPVSASMPLTEAAEQLRRLHVAAVNKGDAAAAAALFTVDGVFLPPGHPALEGSSAIRSWFERLFEGVSVQGFEIQPQSTQTYGDALVEHGTWQATFHPKGGSQAMPGNGAYITIYARGTDGTVRVTKDIFHGLPA